MDSEPSTVELPSEFWDHVLVGSPVECWVWAGADTYPTWRGQRANRLALASRVPMPPIGRDLDPGERAFWWALHHCDNPVCVNPDHLYWGTPLENAKDHQTRAPQCESIAGHTRKRCRGRALYEIDGVKMCGAHRKVVIQGGPNEHDRAVERLTTRIAKLERLLADAHGKLAALEADHA